MLEDEELRVLGALRDRLRTVLEDVAAGRVSREYGNSEIADLQQEMARLDREIAARRLHLGL